MLFKRRISVEEALELDELSHGLQRSRVLLDDGEHIEAGRLRERVAVCRGILSAYASLRQ